MKKHQFKCFGASKSRSPGGMSAVGGDSNNFATTDQLALKNEEDDLMHQFKAVVTNNLLLRYIFKHADFEDLKSCRQVNPLWNSEATKILRQNCLTKPIHLSNSKSSDTCVETLWEASLHPCDTRCSSSRSSCSTMWDSKHKRGTLQAFVDLVEMCGSKSKIKLFPCNQFHLLSIEILDVENFQKLIRFHGEHIRSLHLLLDSIKQSQWKKLEVFLGNQLPNLEYLLLMEIRTRAWDESNFQLFANTNLFMRKLKTLTLDMDYQHPLSKPFLLNMTKVARNLETLNHNWRHDCRNIEANLALLLELDLIHLLKNFSFHFNALNPSRLQLYSQFVNKSQCQRLEKIEIVNLYGSIISGQNSLKQVADILTKCFDFNAGTLKSIKSYCLPFGLIPSWELSFLPNLTQFDYGDEDSDWTWGSYLCENERPSSRSIFPYGSNLSEKWPNLNSVNILFDLGSQCWNIMTVFGAELIPHRSVKKFSVSFKYREIQSVWTEWVEFFCKLFPCVTEAYFGSLANFQSACQYIWKLEYLEDLQLGFSLDPISVHEKICVSPCVEAGFTGFTETTCKKFLEHKDEIAKISMEDANNLRVNPSILDLKHLKRLKVHVTCSFCYWDPSWEDQDPNRKRPNTDDSNTEEGNYEEIDSNFVTADTDAKAERKDKNDNGDIRTGNVKVGDSENQKQFDGESAAAKEAEKGLIKEALNSDSNEEEIKNVKNDSQANSESEDSDDDDGNDYVISDITKRFAFGMCPMLEPKFITFTINRMKIL